MKFLRLPVLLLAMLAPAHAALFQNGSFENNGGNNTSVAAGWDFTLTGPFSLNVDDNEGRTDGLYAVAFNCNGQASSSTLSQTFDTVAGQRYHITFDLGLFGSGTVQDFVAGIYDGTSSTSLGIAGSGTVTNGVGANDSGLVISSNGTQIQLSDYTASGAPQTGPAPNAEFSMVGYDFVAQSSSSIISFQDFGANPGADMMLDNVTVTAVAAVPEPAASMLGLLCLGAATLRRRRKA